MVELDVGVKEISTLGYADDFNLKGSNKIDVMKNGKTLIEKGKGSLLLTATNDVWVQ